MSDFICPYCFTQARILNIEDEPNHPFGVVVCTGCAGYVRRQYGEWHPVSYEEVGALARASAMFVAQLEAQRIALVESWLREDPYPPTAFAVVMTNMVMMSGFDVCRWRGKDDE